MCGQDSGVEGVRERGEVRLKWAGCGNCVTVAEGHDGPLHFVRQNGQESEQSGWGEKPQISCPLAGNLQAFGGGKESREGENRRKISTYLLNTCVGTREVPVPSLLDFTEY